MFGRAIRSWSRHLRRVRTAIIGLALLVATVEALLQYRETLFIEALSARIIADAGAVTPREKTLALRD